MHTWLYIGRLDNTLIKQQELIRKKGVGGDSKNMAGDSTREQYFPVQESDEREMVAQLELNVGARRQPKKFTP